MSTHTTQSIGKEAALALFESKWWEGKTDREIAEFQMLTDELCIPFSEFHRSVEKTLGRPVLTHEFAANFQGLLDELFGERPSPSFDEIMDLIPEDKLILITVDPKEKP